MIPNVDVDRISLEDRIKALEGRLPGGGTIPFPIGTDPINYWLAIKDDYDSLPNMKCTRIKNAFVTKVEMPDVGTATGAGILNGIDMRIMRLVPILGKFSLGGEFDLLYCRLKNNRGQVTPQNSTIAPKRLAIDVSEYYDFHRPYIGGPASNPVNAFFRSFPFSISFRTTANSSAQCFSGSIAHNISTDPFYFQYQGISTAYSYAPCVCLSKGTATVSFIARPYLGDCKITPGELNQNLREFFPVSWFV